jgi:hypothetical protein
MQSDQIENLLRRAPRVPAPSGLLESLKAEISLPTKRSVQPVEDYTPSFFRRWLPALSVAIWFLACIIILAVQSNQLKKLKLENEAARAAALQTQQPIPSSDMELNRLRAESAEAQKLRAEIGQLTAQLQELESLKAENRRLLTELRKPPTGAVAPEQDFFSQAARNKCINNLKQVGLAARMWANHNKDVLPTDFDQMQAELQDRRVLFCPANEGTLQYELISPGASETDPQVVYARCPLHNKVVLCDGSVQSLGDTHRLVIRPDGKTVIGK